MSAATAIHPRRDEAGDGFGTALCAMLAPRRSNGRSASAAGRLSHAIRIAGGWLIEERASSVVAVFGPGAGEAEDGARAALLASLDVLRRVGSDRRCASPSEQPGIRVGISSGWLGAAVWQAVALADAARCERIRVDAPTARLARGSFDFVLVPAPRLARVEPGRAYELHERSRDRNRATRGRGLA